MQLIDVLKKLREIENPSEAVKLAIENTKNLGEGRIDDLNDARAEKEAESGTKKKPEAKTVVKGKRYGGANQKNDVPEKDEELDEDGPGAKWRRGYEASGHPPGHKHSLGVGPVGGTFQMPITGYDGEQTKRPVNKWRDESDPLQSRDKMKLSTTGKPLLQKNAARNLKGAIKSSLGKHGPTNKLPENRIIEDTSEALNQIDKTFETLGWHKSRKVPSRWFGPRTQNDDRYVFELYDIGDEDAKYKFGRVGSNGSILWEDSGIATNLSTSLLNDLGILESKSVVKEGAIKNILISFLGEVDSNKRIQRLAHAGGHFNDVYDALDSILNSSNEFSSLGEGLKSQLRAEGLKHLGYGEGPSNKELGNREPSSDDFKMFEDKFNESMGVVPVSAQIPGQGESRLSITSNYNSDGFKSVNVSAEGDQADALLQLLKMAGVPNQDTDQNCEPEQEVSVEVQEAEPDLANAPDPQVHTSTSQMMSGGNDLNKPKKQNFTIRPRGDNPMAAESKFWKAYEAVKSSIAISKK
jgi:hypothetical protein